MPSLSLFADRCVLGGVTTPRRIAAARIDIEGCVIHEVTEMDRASIDANRTISTTTDLGDRLVVPAFVNGHTHLAMSAFRGLQGSESLGGNVIEDLYFKLESGLSASDVNAFTRMGAYESLLSGVATVFDHYYHGEACAQALAEVGLTGVIAPTLQDLAGPGATGFEAQLDATTAIAESSRLAAAGVCAALGPHATDTVSAELWQRVNELARHLGLPVHAHVAQSFEELRRCHERHGMSPLAWLAREGALAPDLRSLFVHVIYASAADLALLDPDAHTLGFCPYSQVEFCFPAPVATWCAAGLRWLVATDCAPSNDAMDVQKELRLASGHHAFEVTYSDAQRAFHLRGGPNAAMAVDTERRAALERSQALREPDALLDHVWSIPGTWHPQLPCGAIEPGRWANLLVLDPNHPALWPGENPLRALVMSSVPPAIESMIVAGSYVGEPGGFQHLRQTPAYAAARREADERLRAHRRRLGL